MPVPQDMVHTPGGDCAVCAFLTQRANDPRPDCRCWKPTANEHQTDCPVSRWAIRREAAILGMYGAHLDETPEAVA